MIIDLKEYVGLKDDFLLHYKKNGFANIGMFCATSGLPYIAAASYILEIKPNDHEATELKERMIKFYGYTSILS